MRARRLAVLLGVSGLAPAACEVKDPVILELEGEAVRRSDFERHLAGVTRGLGPVDPAARRGILEAFLEERALVIEARRRGRLPPGGGPEDEPRAVARLMADAVRPAEVSEDEIAAYYRDHGPELTVPETVTLRQIVVGTLNEARDVRRRLASNPRAFEVIARTRSKGEEAGAGGYLGSFERGQLPSELEAAVFALPEGATSEPVETGLGYHVVRVESRQPARAPTLEEARGTIRARLARARRAEGERAFVAEVLARAKVNHEAALRPSPPS
ncbi:MAG TPA: peptidylprolyl isomerase [Vicinamibacteria bacterium]|nr:peptidylprolyl isomerase [Vicinamibacteria bacterium]